MNRYEILNGQRLLVETKKRVAAYCHVSTNKDDQANSFESQQRYFKEYIERNPDWELYEIFADEGMSGTSTKKRKAFNRMISCAKNGDFDLIITKEISRFARNTLDSVYYTRELKKHGVGVIFMNDNINTLDADAEFYKNLLDRMVVNDKDHIDVYLNLLPHKWSYAVATSKKLKDSAENQNRNISEMDIGTEVSVLTKNSLNPFSHIDSQSVIGNGYIEVSKWRFLFKGKKDKRNCEIFHMGDNEKRPEVTSDGLNVRVLLGVER